MRLLTIATLVCSVSARLAAQRVTAPATPAHSSVAPPDSAQMMQLMAMNLRPPTRFVLDHRQQLALTEQQLAALAALELALKDSSTARMSRMRASSAAQPRDQRSDSLIAAPMMNWEGTIDEAAIRKQSCANADVQAEAMLGLLRDRVAVGAILTAEQRKKLTPLSMQDMSKLMKPR